MKKWFGTMGIIFGCLWLIPVGSLHAQQIVSIDFSKAQGYTDGHLFGQPAGQAAKWQDGGGSSTGAKLYEINKETLLITQDAGGDRWALFTIPTQTGKFTVTFDWQYVGAADSTVDVGFCISDKANFSLDGNDAPTYNEQGVMGRMYSDPATVSARNGDWAGGGTYDALVELSYTDGIKVFMRYEIDASKAAQTFNVYARKEGSAEVKLAENFGFRQDCPDGLNTIAIWETGTVAGTQVIIDNILLTGPAPVQDWELHE